MNRARGLWLVFFAEVILTAGLALSFPFFAIYLNAERGLPVGTVGAAMSITLLLVAFSHGLGGELSDLIGRRRVMGAAMWGRSVLTLAMAEGVRRRASPTALIGLLMAGAFVGNFYGPASRGWVADYCGPTERVRAYGLLRVAVNFGWALGPALGGFVAQTSYSAVFYATAAACLATAAIVTLFLEGGAQPARAGTFSPGAALGALRDPRLLRFCVGASLIGVAMGFMVVPLSVYCARSLAFTEAQVGMLFSLNGLMVVATLPWVSRSLSRGRITAVMAAGCLFYCAGYAIVGLAHGFRAVALGVATVSLGEVAVSPGLHAMAANLAPDALKGRYLGAASFMNLLGFAAAPLMSGILMERLGARWPASPWVAVVAVAASAATVFRALGGRVSRREEGLPELEDLLAEEGVR